MTKPSKNPPAPVGIDDNKKRYAANIEFYDRQLAELEAHMTIIQSVRRQTLQLLGGEIPQRGGRKRQLNEHVTKVLKKFGRPVTVDELGDALQAEGIELGQGRRRLSTCLKTWTASKHGARNKPPRFKWAGGKVTLI